MTFWKTVKPLFLVSHTKVIHLVKIDINFSDDQEIDDIINNNFINIGKTFPKKHSGP